MDDDDIVLPGFGITQSVGYGTPIDLDLPSLEDFTRVNPVSQSWWDETGLVRTFRYDEEGQRCEVTSRLAPCQWFDLRQRIAWRVETHRRKREYRFIRRGKDCRVYFGSHGCSRKRGHWRKRHVCDCGLDDQFFGPNSSFGEDSPNGD